MRKLIRALVFWLGVTGAACGGPVACIARGARVRVPGGDRPIEELEVGDAVMCADPSTGELTATVITHIRRAKRECVSLAIDAATLTCTSDHPLYCPQTGQWAPAGDWVTGNRSALLCLTGDRLVRLRIAHAEFYAGLHEVFDLTVADAQHNFIANGVLVHNKQPTCTCACADGGGSKTGACSFVTDGGSPCAESC